MAWIDELQNEMLRRDSSPSTERRQNGADDDVNRARSLVRSVLEQMNRELLEGRGSVWESDLSWGLRLWELWWGQAHIEGRYVIVTLLRDSRGTPYLKVQRTRIALRDPFLERRLQRAMRTAFLQPNVYDRKALVSSGERDLQRSS